jgi:hypothetical protein
MLIGAFPLVCRKLEALRIKGMIRLPQRILICRHLTGHRFSYLISGLITLPIDKPELIESALP